ncbi:DUF5610 domain-containing protein [Pseudoteredinibacter isoporae]|uniref:DUF5610 domain-containing protein n=1 Tax=Pseudoteredinibacter isoporae TaxID=570281 RepID=A0A7X0MVC1_9GAMM|nr:DUF5610 domain-containing protein [Pseudoteredinibacter isoporae]MBB6521581.1 hypothetical protein [Pseudoteredinibacter isoporae]NHO87135.1 DUF5610 domain-containing protein [Pseudoteredinibacter isoporae]NIB22959.1 DUF5610 domain-containing protein [Pseudoteredinibacter isoporae]
MIVQYSQSSSSFLQESFLFRGSNASNEPAQGQGSREYRGDSAAESRGKVVELQVQRYSDEQSFALFERRLAVSQFTSSSHSTAKLTSAEAPKDGNSAQAVADSILGFIANRLEQDKQNGASPEQLQSRLEAGLKGFERGFGEASSMLEDLDLLSNKVEADIGETYQRVHDGISQLAEDYDLQSPLADEADEAKDITPITNSEAPVKKSEAPSHEVGVSAARQEQIASIVSQSQPLQAPERLQTPAAEYQSYELDYSRGRSFQFEVQTQDGDTISIDAASLIRYQESQHYLNNGGDEFASASFKSSEDYAALINIEGDIDEGEWQAFTELFDQVLDLAENFYEGDVAQAFDQALNLGYNGEEIAQFSLNLQQTTSVKQAAVYQAIEPQSSPWQQVSSPISTLQQYAEDLLSATRDFSNKGLPLELLPELMEASQEQSSKEQQSFLKALLS